jgi:hypothetical protein
MGLLVAPHLLVAPFQRRQLALLVAIPPLLGCAIWCPCKSSVVPTSIACGFRRGKGMQGIPSRNSI